MSLTPSLTHLHDAKPKHPERSLEEEGDNPGRERERIIELESENAMLIKENMRLRSEVQQLKQHATIDTTIYDATDHEYPDLSACSDYS